MKSDIYYMKLALKEAKKAFERDEVPVGAVLVIDDKVIAKGFNLKETKVDISSHAEIEVLKKASKKLGSYILDKATLYVTLEPCLMCCGAILQSRIKRIVIGTKDRDNGAIISKYHIFDSLSPDLCPLITSGVMEEDCKNILQLFFKQKR